MVKRRHKKRKLKKNILIVLLFIILVLSIVFGFVFMNSNKKTDNKKDITNNYVTIMNDSDLYDKHYKKVGKVEKGLEFKITGDDVKYLNIVGTDFYVSKNDVSFVKQEVKGDLSHYLELGKKIITKDNFSLVNDDKKIEVNAISNFKVMYVDNDNYYVKLGDKFFKINKNEVSDVKEYKVKKQGSEKISIINFININNSCNTFECYSVEDTKKVLDYIKKSGYYTINVDEFKNWDGGNVRLKEKAVLLMSSDNTDIVKNINSEYNNMINIYTPESGFTYLNNNTTNSINTNFSALNNYNVYKETSLNEIKGMLKGDEVNPKFFDGEVATSVPVVNYHFFYDLSKGQTDCNESICLEVSKFRKQLDYLRDNGYTALTMNQFLRWINGEIDVPKKSVLLTIDDGAYGTGFHNNNNLIPILEEYKMHATLFLISGWWDINNYKSSYLEIQSHTHDMHNKGSCGEAQLICSSYNEIMNDLSLSISTIGNKDTFCYPFYEYDDEAIKALKDSGFKIAFGGGSVNATRKSNKYVIPRYPIHDSTSLDRFIKMVS